MSDYWMHVDHPDDEKYDKVTIECVPRWKESELSGDEYRFSYVVKAWRKGEVLVTRSWSRLEWALMGLQYTIFIHIEDEGFDEEAWKRTRELCDQPGCENEPTVFYKRKKPFTKQGEELVDNRYRKQYRQFCTIHKHRGDCALDDADANYEVIPDPRIKKEN